LATPNNANQQSFGGLGKQTGLLKKYCVGRSQRLRGHLRPETINHHSGSSLDIEVKENWQVIGYRSIDAPVLQKTTASDFVKDFQRVWRIVLE
jgi:hypothetical protein